MDVAGIKAQLTAQATTIADVQTKVTALVAGGTAVPVATQADLDEISAGIATNQTALETVKAT